MLLAKGDKWGEPLAKATMELSWQIGSNDRVYSINQRVIDMPSAPPLWSKDVLLRVFFMRLDVKYNDYFTL